MSDNRVVSNDKAEVAALIFNKLGNFSKGLTAKQIGLKPPANHSQIYDAFQAYKDAGMDLDLLIENMQSDLDESL